MIYREKIYLYIQMYELKYFSSICLWCIPHAFLVYAFGLSIFSFIVPGVFHT